MKRQKKETSNKKETISFCSVKSHHVTKHLGLQYSPQLALLFPQRYESVVASEGLIAVLESARCGDLDMSTDAGKSDVIMGFILEAQRHFPSHLSTMQQVKLIWKDFKGFIDIAVCTQDMESIILVVEAKRGWLNGKVYQLLAEAGCLLQQRDEELGKKTPVLGLLSDGYRYQFFAIDERDKSVYSSNLITLEISRTPNFRTNPQVSEILNWIIWFIKIVVAVSPPSTPQPFIPGKQPRVVPSKALMLRELRSCFTRGP